MSDPRTWEFGQALARFPLTPVDLAAVDAVEKRAS